MAGELKEQLIQKARSRRQRQGKRGLSKRPPRPQQPRGIERSYRARLREVAEMVEGRVRENILENLSSIVEQAGARDDSADIRSDNWAQELERLVRATTISLEDDIEEMAESLAREAAANLLSHNREQMNRLVRRVLGVDIFESDDRLSGLVDSWAAENARLIRSIPNQSLDRIEGLTQRAIRQGTSTRDITKQIRKEFGVTQRRARVIARDQIASLNSDITRERQREIGIEEYEWSTAADERVRGDPGGRYPDAIPSHYQMDGKRCRWDDPTVYRDGEDEDWKARSGISGPEQHPGNPIMCRCVGLPILDDILEEVDDDENA